MKRHINYLKSETIENSQGAEFPSWFDSLLLCAGPDLAVFSCFSAYGFLYEANLQLVFLPWPIFPTSQHAVGPQPKSTNRTQTSLA